MKFDPGHGYQNDDHLAALDEEGKVMLWVFGALDELASLGIVEIAGDRPLRDRESRRSYRHLKAAGYQPTMKQVAGVLRKYVAEMLSEDTLALFRGILDKGWDEIRRLHREAKEEEARDAQIRRDFGWGDDWIPL